MLTPCSSSTDSECPHKVCNAESGSSMQDISTESWHRKYFEEHDCQDTVKSSHSLHCKPSVVSLVDQPIEIQENKAVKVDLPSISWQGYDCIPNSLCISNTGRTTLINGQWQNGKPLICGGPLNGSYMFSQIHFHCPSEHEINGTRFPLEMHVVHYKTSYLTQERAMQEKDGTVVLVYLFKVKNIHETVISQITRLAPCLQKVNNQKEIPNMPLNLLVKPFCSNYFVYWGSIRSEKKSYLLQWIINCTQLDVTANEVDAMLNLLNVSGAHKNRLPKMKPENSMIFHVCRSIYNNHRPENFETLNTMNSSYNNSECQNSAANYQQWPNLDKCLKTMDTNMGHYLHQNNPLDPNNLQWSTASQNTSYFKSYNSTLNSNNLSCSTNPHSHFYMPPLNSNVQKPSICAANTSCNTNQPTANLGFSKTNLRCLRCLNSSPSKNFSPCQTVPLASTCPQCTNSPSGPFCPDFLAKQDQLCSHCAAALQETRCPKCFAPQKGALCSRCSTNQGAKPSTVQKSPSRIRRFLAPLRSASVPGPLSSKRCDTCYSKKNCSVQPNNTYHNCPTCPKCFSGLKSSKCPKCSTAMSSSPCPICSSTPQSPPCPKCTYLEPIPPCPRCSFDVSRHIPCPECASRLPKPPKSDTPTSAPCAPCPVHPPCTTNQSSQTTPPRQASPLAQPNAAMESSPFKETTSPDKTIAKECTCSKEECHAHQKSKTSLGNSPGSCCTCSSKDEEPQVSPSRVSTGRSPKKPKKALEEYECDSKTKSLEGQKPHTSDEKVSELKSRTSPDAYKSSDSEENISLVPSTKKSVKKTSRKNLKKSDSSSVRWNDSPKINDKVSNHHVMLERDETSENFFDAQEEMARRKKSGKERRKAKSVPSEKSVKNSTSTKDATSSRGERGGNLEKENEPKESTKNKIKTLFSKRKEEKKLVTKNSRQFEENNEVQVNFLYAQTGTRRVFSIPAVSQFEKQASEPEFSPKNKKMPESNKSKHNKLESSKSNSKENDEDKVLYSEIGEYSKDVIVNTATLASGFKMPRDELKYLNDIQPKKEISDFDALAQQSNFSKDNKNNAEKPISFLKQKSHLEIQQSSHTFQECGEKVQLNQSILENTVRIDFPKYEDPKNLHILLKDGEVNKEHIDQVSLKLNFYLKDTDNEYAESFHNPIATKKESICKDAETQYSASKFNSNKKTDNLVINANLSDANHHASQKTLKQKDLIPKKEKSRKDARNKRKKNKKEVENENLGAEINNSQAKDLKLPQTFKSKIYENRTMEVLSELKNFKPAEKIVEKIYQNQAVTVISPPQITKPFEIVKNDFYENRITEILTERENVKPSEAIQIEEIPVVPHRPVSSQSNPEVEEKNEEEKVIMTKNKRSLKNLIEKRKKIVYFMYDKIKRDPSTGKKIFVGSFKTKEELETGKRKNMYHYEQSNSLFSASRVNDDMKNWKERDDANSEKLLKIENWDSGVFKKKEKKKYENIVDNKNWTYGNQKNMAIHKFIPQHVLKDKNNLLIGKVSRVDDNSENYEHFAHILDLIKNNKEKIKKHHDDSTSKTEKKWEKKDRIYESIPSSIIQDVISTTTFEKFVPVIKSNEDKPREKCCKTTEMINSEEAVLLIPIEVDSLSKVELFVVENSNDTQKKSKEYIPCLNCYKRSVFFLNFHYCFSLLQ